MSNLVPVQRRDKNGRLVTRHVRDDSAATNTTPSIPPPTTATAKDRMNEAVKKHELSESVIEVIYDFNYDNGDMLDLNGEVVHEYGSEEAVDAVSELFSSPHLKTIREVATPDNATPRTRRLIAEKLHSYIQPYCTSVQFGDNPRGLTEDETNSIINTVRYAHVADNFADPDVPDFRIAMALKRTVMTLGNEEQDIDEHKDSRAMTPEEVVTAGFILRLIAIRSPKESLQYVLENHDRIKKHQKILKERGSIDPGLLDQLDDAESAVSSGVL